MDPKHRGAMGSEGKGASENFLVQESRQVFQEDTRLSIRFRGNLMAHESKHSVYFNQIHSKENDCHLNYHLKH